MAVSDINMTISARVYGFLPGWAIAWALRRLGASDDTALRWAMRCVLVRMKVGGRHSSWVWGGR